MPGSSGWRIGGLRFAPSRAITLVTLLLLPLLVAVVAVGTSRRER